MVPRKSNEKSEGEKEIKMWFPKTLSYGQDLLGGVLLLLIQRGERRRAGGGGGGGGCYGRREDFAVSIEMPQCLTAGSREGAEDHGPRPGSGPQRAAREAEWRGRGLVTPLLLTFPSPA